MNYYLAPYQWINNSWQPPATTVGAIDLRNLIHMGTPIVVNGLGFFATTGIIAGANLLGQGDLRDINSTGAMKSMWDSLLGYRPKGDKLVDLLYDHLTAGADPTGVIACRPLMPAKGNLTIHLQGHSVVKATQFRFGHSPESNKVISVLQEDYRKIRDLVLGGDLPANHHRKVLDFWGEQYRIKDPHLLFIPNGLPIELPLPHNTSISENLDGVDNDVVGKELAWVEPDDGSHWENLNNAASPIQPSSGEDNRSIYANSALSGAGQQCEITATVAVDTTLTMVGPCCRRSSSAVTYYVARFDIASGDDKIFLNKVVTGTLTVLGSQIVVTVSIPDTIKMTVIGSSLEAFFNNVSKSALTDTAITGNLFCGLYGRSNPAETQTEMDDFSAEDIISAGVDNGSALLMGLL